MALGVLIAVAVGALAYQSRRTGLNWRELLVGSSSNQAPRSAEPLAGAGSILPPRPQIDFLQSQKIGRPVDKEPQITFTGAADLDQDGLIDVVICDAAEHRVSWIRQYPRGVFVETICAPDADQIMAPAHVQPIDFDFDGDVDLLVAALGDLFPSNASIGSVYVLENDGDMNFTQRKIATELKRVADVRGGDLDGDGDMDLVVAMFGAFEGGTCWLENQGDWSFQQHSLQNLSGPINCPIFDLDGNGTLDFVLLVSQEWEEIYFFLNDGHGQFTSKLIWGATNEDFGSGNIRLVDFDQDGDVDILYTNGDSWDYFPSEPRPWHGVHWLENKGDLRFVSHRLVTFGGPYSAMPMDVDSDGDLDVVVTSMFNDWENPNAKSIIWLENNGEMQFARRDITGTPTHIQTAIEADFNGDGKIDFITGGMYTDPPYEHMERILLWSNHWPAAPISSR